MSDMRTDKSARAVGHHRIANPPPVGDVWISVGLHNFLEVEAGYPLNTTSCSIDMDGIVKGLYLENFDYVLNEGGYHSNANAFKPSEKQNQTIIRLAKQLQQKGSKTPKDEFALGTK